MVRYTSDDYINMVRCYEYENYNSVAASNRYHEIYPNSNQPSPTTILRASNRLSTTGSVAVVRDNLQVSSKSSERKIKKVIKVREAFGNKSIRQTASLTGLPKSTTHMILQQIQESDEEDSQIQESRSSMRLRKRKSVQDNLNNQPNALLAVVVFSFLVGYMIYHLSNLQKDKFRRNPYLKDVSHLDSILTNKGKKIIVSGFWGFLRRPNYFGDLIMNWSMAGLVLNHDVIPYYSAICCTVVLIHRAVRDNARCKARYGAAWEQYCSRVKSVILKRVF